MSACSVLLEFQLLVLILITFNFNSSLGGIEEIQSCHIHLVKALQDQCDRFYALENYQNRRGESFSQLKRRLPRNVVDECCRNSCNLSTLRKYCSRVNNSIDQNRNTQEELSQNNTYNNSTSNILNLNEASHEVETNEIEETNILQILNNRNGSSLNNTQTSRSVPSQIHILTTPANPEPVPLPIDFDYPLYPS